MGRSNYDENHSSKDLKKKLDELIFKKEREISALRQLLQIPEINQSKQKSDTEKDSDSINSKTKEL